MRFNPLLRTTLTPEVDFTLNPATSTIFNAKTLSEMNLVAKMLLFVCILLVLFEKMSTTSPPIHREISNELHFIHHEIGLLKEENQNQNIEISLLKKMVTKSHQEPEENMEEVDPGRPIRKRPVRLLPPRILFGEKNISDVQQPTIRPFYGPPTNCIELSKLGYTLNGFYLVKPNISEITYDFTQVETVYCAFKQPPGTFNMSKIEKRIDTKMKGKNDTEKPRKKIDVGKIVWNFRSKENGDDDLSIQERTSTNMPISVSTVSNKDKESINVPTSSTSTVSYKEKSPTFRPIGSLISIDKSIPCVCNNSKVDNRIHFYARMQSLNNKLVLQDLDVIKYDELLLNLGKALNATSGVFTVPKSGVYQFFLQGAFSLTNFAMNINFFITVLRNGHPMEFITFSQSNLYSPRSMLVTSKLVRGDKILLKYFKREQNQQIEGIVALYRFVFSGFLLEED